jgi:DNA-binding NarL/FixJ family response regulator
MTAAGPIRVLVADDHAVTRAGIVSMLLTAPDLEVVAEAGDGVEAVERTLEHRPDVLVLDIQMPRGGGLETVRALRGAHVEVAILLLSFHSETVMALPFLREGANGYLSKENAGDALLEAIRHVAGGGRYLSPAVTEQIARRITSLVASPPHDRLSAQELVVLSLMAAGKSAAQVGAELLLSRRAVNRCYGRIVEKTGLGDARAVMEYALAAGVARTPLFAAANRAL